MAKHERGLLSSSCFPHHSIALQDPYHNTGQAMGLSFSVPPGKAVPSSLQNIYKELRDDCSCTVPKHGNLEKVCSRLWK